MFKTMFQFIEIGHLAEVKNDISSYVNISAQVTSHRFPSAMVAVQQ